MRTGDGDGTSGDMERRVTRLEEQMLGVREDLRDIKDQLRGFGALLPTLATKRDMMNYLIAGLTIVVAIVGLVIGGLGWLETRTARVQPATSATAPAPVVIQMPPYAAPAPPARRP